MSNRLDELLPWYVNGSLNAEDRAWVEQYLREHPKAAGQLRFYEGLRARLNEDTPEVSDEIGLDKALARIRAGAAVPTPLQWLRERLARWSLTPGLAFALVLVAAQAVLIASLMGTPEDATEIRATPPHDVAPAPTYIKLNLAPDAREVDIRLLLIEVQASIAAGPTQLGDYYLRIAPAQRDAALARLRDSPLVQGASAVDGLPGRE